jgi:rhodanese-related sulfurtransferase
MSSLLPRPTNGQTVDAPGQAGTNVTGYGHGAVAPRSIDEILDEARRRLVRVSAVEAAASMAAGGLLVDIRPVEQRRRDGEVPGALIVDRNVLEWRLDPRSAHRIPDAARPDRHVMVLCNEGYASSLAAATLRDLGLDATDVVGGIVAWIAAGLPVVPASGNPS